MRKVILDNPLFAQVPLTDKQERFCNEYLSDFNATQAAIRAGFSKKTATEQGYQLLMKPAVQEYLQSMKEKIASKFDVTHERVLQEIVRVAFQDARKFYNEDGSLIPIHLLDDDAAAALAGMEIEELSVDKMVVGALKKIKRWDKMKALEMLAKHKNIYSDAPINNNQTIKFGYGPEQPV